MKDICVPGFFCVNPYLFILLVSGLIFFTVFSDKILRKQTKEIVYQLKEDPNLLEKKSFYNRIYDVLSPPIRKYTGNYPNVHTAGDSLPNFQQVGFLYRPESDVNYNPEDVNRLALYSRPRYAGSNKHEYYTIDSKTGIKVSLGDNLNEVYSGDNMNVKGFEGDFQAEIYETEGPRYNPWG